MWRWRCPCHAAAGRSTATPASPVDKPARRDYEQSWGKYNTPAKRRKRILIVAVVLVVVIGGVFLLRYLSSYESTDDAEVDAHLNPISARVDGTITNVYVDDNQVVKAGDPLFRLDDRQQRARQVQLDNLLERGRRHRENVACVGYCRLRKIPSSCVDQHMQLSPARGSS